MNLPHATDLVEVQKLRQKLGYINITINIIIPMYITKQYNFSLDQSSIEEKIVQSKLLLKEYSHITCSQFAQYLDVPVNSISLQQLFRLYDKVSSNYRIFKCLFFFFLFFRIAQE